MCAIYGGGDVEATTDLCEYQHAVTEVRRGSRVEINLSFEREEFAAGYAEIFERVERGMRRMVSCAAGRSRQHTFP